MLTKCQTLKYAGLPSSFIFQPVAIETLGQYNRSALNFIGEIDRPNRTSLSTGNKRETSFLFQRLSVCIQRVNLVAFKGTFLTTEDEAWSSGHNNSNNNNNTTWGIISTSGKKN